MFLTRRDEQEDNERLARKMERYSNYAEFKNLILGSKILLTILIVVALISEDIKVASGLLLGALIGKAVANYNASQSFRAFISKHEIEILTHEKKFSFIAPTTIASILILSFLIASLFLFYHSIV